MPQNITPPSLKSVGQKRPQRLKGGRWWKRAAILFVVILGLLVSTHLVIRFVIWPQIEKSKPALERLIGARLGAEVSIDTVEVSWEGMRPAFRIQDLRFINRSKSANPLEIQNISGELSWLSFYHLKPYFHQLNFDGAEIDIQRNEEGVVAIAGIPLNPDSKDFSAENWLLAQNNIAISNSKIHWQDLNHKKLKATIEIQNLALINGIRNHSASLTIVSPWHSGPLTVNAEFAHRLNGQAGNWRDWIGNFSWDIAELNLIQLTQDFNLPITILTGTLNSKGHLSIDKGLPDGGDASFKANQLRIQLSKESEPLEFGHLETNFIQTNKNKLLSITTQNFSWRDFQSAENSPLKTLSPMTFRWRPPENGTELKEFGFASPNIRIEDAALFALNLPLPKKIRHWIGLSKTHGELQNVEISWAENKSSLATLPIPGNFFNTSKLDFDISAKLNDVSFIGPSEGMPNVDHLSGILESNENKGFLLLNSSNLELTIDNFLADPKLKFASAVGKINWEKAKDGWVFHGNKLSINSPDLSANFSGTYSYGGPKLPDQISLDMQFPSANLSQAYRYLPVGINNETRSYLSKAFSEGKIQNGKLHIKGDPNLIPFSNSKDGEFSLDLPITMASFKPAPLLPISEGIWPELSRINGVVKMRQSAFILDVSEAAYKRVAIDQAHASIADVASDRLVLQLNASANGDVVEMLDYISPSPIGKNQPSIDKNLRVSGPAKLELDLKLPLSGSNSPKIDAHLILPGNKAQWGELPPLENLKGTIRITEENPEFEELTANLLGGSFSIASLPSSSQPKSFSISGRATASSLKDYLGKLAPSQITPLINAANGSINYEGILSLGKAKVDANFKFDLRNFNLNAPAPFKKAMGVPFGGQLSIHTNSDAKGDLPFFEWSGKFNDVFFTQGSISTLNQVRYALGIGSPSPPLTKGSNINIQVNELNLDAWQTFLHLNKSHPEKFKDNPVPSDELDTQVTGQIKKLILSNRIWPDFNFAANHKNNVIQSRINSSFINGQLQWKELDGNNPNGAISGKLTSLKIPKEQAPSELEQPQSQPKSVAQNSLSLSELKLNVFPNLDLTIDDFSWEKGQLGSIKLKTSAAHNLYKIDTLQINNPQGNAIITGQWTSGTQDGNDRSSMDIDLNIRDIGIIISRLSNPKAIEGGKGKVTGKLEWVGSPFEPQLETLAGKVNFDLENGRLLEVDSDTAKLLNVLSLQSLFKFATLDIQGSVGNLISRGTAFNSIVSKFDIRDGVARATQFTMELNQARVAMSGIINIPKETQDLRITIFPTLDATAGSLAAFAINPIVGLSVVVGQYLLTNQINRAMQSDYLVQGSWSNPEILPLDQTGQPLDHNVLDNIRTKGLLKEQTKPRATSPSSSNSPIAPPVPN